MYGLPFSIEPKDFSRRISAVLCLLEDMAFGVVCVCATYPLEASFRFSGESTNQNVSKKAVGNASPSKETILKDRLA